MVCLVDTEPGRQAIIYNDIKQDWTPQLSANGMLKTGFDLAVWYEETVSLKDGHRHLLYLGKGARANGRSTTEDGLQQGGIQATALELQHSQLLPSCASQCIPQECAILRPIHACSILPRLSKLIIQTCSM